MCETCKNSDTLILASLCPVRTYSQNLDYERSANCCMLNFRHPCVYNYKITVCIVMFILSCSALTWSQKRKHITSMSVLSWVHRHTLNQQPKSLMCSSLPLVPKNPDSSQKPFRRLECSFPLPVLKKPPQALHVFKITRMILICERLASTK
jgi:hypothetical protein